MALRTRWFMVSLWSLFLLHMAIHAHSFDRGESSVEAGQAFFLMYFCPDRSTSRRSNQLPRLKATMTQYIFTLSWNTFTTPTNLWSPLSRDMPLAHYFHKHKLIFFFECGAEGTTSKLGGWMHAVCSVGTVHKQWVIISKLLGLSVPSSSSGCRADSWCGRSRTALSSCPDNSWHWWKCFLGRWHCWEHRGFEFGCGLWKERR